MTTNAGSTTLLGADIGALLNYAGMRADEIRAPPQGARIVFMKYNISKQPIDIAIVEGHYSPPISPLKRILASAASVSTKTCPQRHRRIRTPVA